MDKRLIHYICVANDQGHRAAHHRTDHPIDNVYHEKDWGGATHLAWQIGYDTERSRIEYDNQQPSVCEGKDND